MSQPTNGSALAAALRSKASEVREVYSESTVDNQVLRDAASLLRVLANVVEGMPLLKALGAPGDWGYETDLGRGVVAIRGAAPLRDRAGPAHWGALTTVAHSLRESGFLPLADRVQEAHEVLTGGATIPMHSECGQRHPVGTDCPAGVAGTFADKTGTFADTAGTFADPALLAAPGVTEGRDQTFSHQTPMGEKAEP